MINLISITQCAELIVQNYRKVHVFSILVTIIWFLLSFRALFIVHHIPDPDGKLPVLTQNGPNPVILHLGAPYIM